MNFDKDIEKYLSGSEFTDALNCTIAKKEKSIPFRIEFIESVITGKRIIHMGCVDHLPIIEEKIKKNTWLHNRLVEKSEFCLGIDINEEGIDHMKKMGYPDVICHNIIEDIPCPEIINTKWDYMIMGEILEHVDNPVMFLSSIKEKYSGCIDKIIITVPSAFRYVNFKYILKGIEKINSDHRYWFTPYTLAKIVSSAGLKVESFQMCETDEFSKSGFVKKFVLKRYPGLRDILLMIIKV